jgi:hypothetical protein
MTHPYPETVPAGADGGTLRIPGYARLRLPNPTASWVEALEILLPPGQAAAIEHGGATAVLELIAGEPLIAEVLTNPVWVLTQRERLLIGERGDIACRRGGRLRTESGIPAAETTATFWPDLLPEPVLLALGHTPSGTPTGNDSVVPLGKALAGLGACRRQLHVTATPGHKDADGYDLILFSEALLTLSGVPFAVATERVYLAFAEAFPLPWLPRTMLPGDAAAQDGTTAAGNRLPGRTRAR